jgi:hypothetical protein
MLGEAAASEDAQFAVGGCHAEEQGVRRRGTHGAAGAAVDQVGRHGQRLCLERQWSCTVI